MSEFTSNNEIIQEHHNLLISDRKDKFKLKEQ